MRLRDPDAYLERIGLDHDAALSEVHRAHVTTIPFEDLDPLHGRPLLVERPVGGASTPTELELAEVPQVLGDLFGLRGVTVGENGRVAP